MRLFLWLSDDAGFGCDGEPADVCGCGCVCVCAFGGGGEKGGMIVSNE